MIFSIKLQQAHVIFVLLMNRNCFQSNAGTNSDNKEDTGYLKGHLSLDPTKPTKSSKLKKIIIKLTNI